MSTANSAIEIAKRLESEGMRCNCDLDNWEPEKSTGHSCVCRIHKAATEERKYPRAPSPTTATPPTHKPA